MCAGPDHSGLVSIAATVTDSSGRLVRLRMGLVTLVAATHNCGCDDCTTLAMLLELLSRSHKVGCMAPFRPYSLTPGQRLEVEVVQPDGSGAPSTASISAS